MIDPDEKWVLTMDDDMSAGLESGAQFTGRRTEVGTSVLAGHIGDIQFDEPFTAGKLFPEKI